MVKLPGDFRRFGVALCAIAAAAVGSVAMTSLAWSAGNDAGSVVVPLIKLEYPGEPRNIRMLYVRLLALGEHKVDQPLLFDTGSAGITVDCRVVLPKKLCSDEGIKIKKELEVDGLRVTTETAVSHYGTYDEYGNIAYARVSFGARQRPVATSEPVPLLIRYKRVRRATGEIVGGPLWPKGIFGVSSVRGQVEGKLRSPMGAIDVGAGRRRGFYLSPIGEKWKVCTNEQGNCPQIKALHIGVDDATKSSFKLSKVIRASADHNFPSVDACMTIDGRPVCRPTLFDTGNSTIAVADRSTKGDQQSSPIDEEVSVSGESFGWWSFKTKYRPEVELVPSLDTNIVGIRYFETNSLLFDLESGEIGFRIGQ